MLKTLLIIIFGIIGIIICISRGDAYPIKLTENGIFLKCDIGRQRGYCKFDTGSLKNFLMPNIGASKNISGKSCFSAYGDSFLCSENIRVKKIRLNGRYYYDVDFIKHPTNLYSFTNYPVLGVIGLELFKNSVLSFDLKNKYLKIAGDAPQNVSSRKTSYELFKNKMFISGIFEGHPAIIVFDSGSSISTVNERYYKRFESYFTKRDKVKAMDAEGKIKEIMSVTNETSKLSIFGLSKHIDFLVVDLKPLEKILNHPIDFIIGYDYLVNEVFTINFKDNIISLLTGY